MSKVLIAGLSLAASLLSTSAFAAPGRLPTGVTPLSYDIIVEPDATKLTFTGSETIAIQVTKPTRTITLNAAEIVISSVKLNGTIAATITADDKAQTATFTFATPVTIGKHSLSLSYSGKINQSATGLFAIDYDNVDGTKDRMLATQFEAPDARRFAPMWDEPGIKTPFKLTAVSPRGQTAFSNMPVTSKSTNAAGKTVWTFAESPKMSSYLLYLGMGNVERKTVMAGTVEIGVITRKGVVDQGDYALASAKQLLAHYNDYFGTPYPLPKMDMIAGPGSSQFFGAMENWGAIFYFERILLIDPKLATESQKQDIFGVVAHEMAHQWFGDLVTMQWWDDLWLNEGFASWMASKAADDLNPEWKSLTQSMAFDRQGAMSRDARVTTHPIIQKISTPDEISQAFDDITYRKGEAVIRMLEGSVGADAFRTGVRSYMAKYKYGNTVTDQLWAEIAKASGRPVKPMMDSFTMQGGVPLVKATITSCCLDGETVSLSLGRFGLDAGSKGAQTWLVPVKLRRVGNPDSAVTNVMVSGPQAQATTMGGPGGATIVNDGQSAYFRTLYDDAHFSKLKGSFADLGVDNQVGLIADSYGLANSGDASVERYLSLISGVSPDASPIVWNLIAGELAGMDRMLTNAPQQAAFRVKARALLAPVFAKVGWTAKPGEASLTALLREGIIPTLGSFDDADMTAQAATYAQASFSDPKSVPGSIRLPALSIFAYTADAARWDILHEKARTENSPVAKLLYYRNLGAVRDPGLAAKALALTLTDEVPVPMRGNIIQAVAGQHPALAFDWAVANADKVNAMLETSTRSAFIVSLPTGSGDPAVAARVTAYAAKALPVTSRKPAETTVAVINYRAGLRARQAAAIGKWAGAK
jgi:aminopeptidase N